MLLTYKIPLNTSRRNRKALESACAHSCDLYNAALEERIGAYSKERKTLTAYDQFKALTVLRQDSDYTIYPVTLQRGPLKRLDLSFKSFFRRLKRKGDKSGFPRFKSKARWSTLEFSDKSGWTVSDKSLRIKGIGKLRLNLHRPLDGEVKALKLTKQNDRWYALISVDVPASSNNVCASCVGIDLGVVHLATLSTGEHIPNLRPFRRAERKLRIKQRQLSRCKRGSKRRKKVKTEVARVHRDIRNRRNTYIHQITASLVKRFSTIYVEDLKLKSLQNKSLSDSSLAKFLECLSYKAERAGSLVERVDPRYTSQKCSSCGKVSKENRKTQADFACISCGYVRNADVNAAINIYQLGRSGSRKAQREAVA